MARVRRSQRLETAGGLALDRAGAAAEGFGDRLDAEVLVEPQHHAGALPRRQVGQRRHQEQAVDHVPRGVVDSTVTEVSRGHLTGRPLAGLIDGHAHHRAARVGPQPVILLQPRPRDVHPDQRLLGDVGGTFPVAAHQVGRPAQRGAAGLCERNELALIPPSHVASRRLSCPTNEVSAPLGCTHPQRPRSRAFTPTIAREPT